MILQKMLKFEVYIRCSSVLQKIKFSFLKVSNMRWLKNSLKEKVGNRVILSRQNQCSSLLELLKYLVHRSVEAAAEEHTIKKLTLIHPSAGCRRPNTKTWGSKLVKRANLTLNLTKIMKMIAANKENKLSSKTLRKASFLIFSFISKNFRC